MKHELTGTIETDGRNGKSIATKCLCLNAWTRWSGEIRAKLNIYRPLKCIYTSHPCELRTALSFKTDVLHQTPFIIIGMQAATTTNKYQ